MSDDLNLQLLSRFGKRATATVSGRQQKEARIVSYSDRRRNRATGRTEQLNMRTSAEFKSRLHALADAAGMYVVEYVEEAVALKARIDAQQKRGAQ